MATRVEGKNNRHVCRLEFTRDPADTDIPIVLADVVCNLRSSLDHLMSCLVPKKQVGHIYFPIYFQGVWDTGIKTATLEGVAIS